jgi:hypothetical protein
MKLHLLSATTVLGATLFVANVGCRGKYTAHDPLEGAIHLPILGQTDPYGQADVVQPTMSAADTELQALAGKYGSDLSILAKALHERWANRAIHEEADGVDVTAVLQDLAAAAGRAFEEDELAIALRRATCRLSDGHLRLHDGPRRQKTLTTGMTVVEANGEFVVAAVDVEHWRSSNRRPKVGDIVEDVDGNAVSEYASSSCLVPGSTPRQRESLAARSLGDQRRFGSEAPGPTKLGIRRGPRRQEIHLLWKPAARVAEPKCIEGKALGKVGILVAHTFDCDREGSSPSSFARQLDDAMASATSGTTHLVLDLRNNPGGSDEHARALARRLLSDNPVWMRFRHAGDAETAFRDELLETADGDSVPWPMSVLIGPGCASTCEILASVLAGRPDTVRIGRPTAGSVGNPQPVQLSKSGFSVWVPRTLYALPGTDVPIEGRGVSPQIEVLTTADDIRRGRDPVLESAVGRAL